MFGDNRGISLKQGQGRNPMYISNGSLGLPLCHCVVKANKDPVSRYCYHTHFTDTSDAVTPQSIKEQDWDSAPGWFTPISTFLPMPLSPPGCNFCCLDRHHLPAQRCVLRIRKVRACGMSQAGMISICREATRLTNTDGVWWCDEQ